jgi:hypothetical protein
MRNYVTLPEDTRKSQCARWPLCCVREVGRYEFAKVDVMGKYKQIDGLVDLRTDRVISSIGESKRFQRSRYWDIRWNGEPKSIKTAMGATENYKDTSLGTMFRIQSKLLSPGIVDEVLLFCKAWDYYYRIPADHFREFRLTQERNCRVFRVTCKDTVSSARTPSPINISNFRQERNPIVEIKIQITLQDIIAIKLATKLKNNAEAVVEAAREFLRLKALSN